MGTPVRPFLARQESPAAAISVKLDDPSFNAPIYANLFDDEQHARGLKRATHLIACALVHRETAFGLQAFQRGQRHEGFLREHFLRPIQQRSRGPNLSAGDHPWQAERSATGQWKGRP